MTETYSRPSGNIMADRRFDYARALMNEGAFVQAADLLSQVLEMVPNWAAGWFAFADALERGGDHAKAISAFNRTLEVDPSDPFGAALHLVRLGKPATSGVSAYVANLFDQYAPRYEAHLVQGLGYRAPILLTAGLNTLAPATHVFDHFIDLGCGTGLMGKALEGRFRRASGVDIAPQMIKHAQKCGLYEELDVAELLEYLRHQPENSADLILAADVFVYIGPLEEIFSQVRRVLQAGGLFGFTVQSHASADSTLSAGFELGEDLRFAHSETHLGQLAAKTGFKIAYSREASARKDKGRDVPGLLIIAR